MLNAKGSTGPGLTIAAAVAILALPSAVLAFATKFEVEKTPSPDSAEIEGLRADTAGPSLARGRSLLWSTPGADYPFTPASNPNRPDRLVTVAVRLNSQALKTITVYGNRDQGAVAANPNLGLAQSAFNLGVSRGYRNFAQEIASSTAVRRPDAADVTGFSLAPSAKHDDPGDAPRALFDDKLNAGRAPHTFAADKDERVDLGGAVKLTRNLDVTAGVRYTQDRERLLPLTDGKRDNQAVYVGTQLHF